MNDLNLQLFHWINLGPGTPAWVLELARLSSKALPAVLLLIVLGVVVRRRQDRWSTVLHAVLATFLAWLVTRELSEAWPAPRPFVLGLGQQWLAHKPTPSFPSSHAGVALALGMVAWQLIPHRRWRWLPLLLSLLVAWSRIALGLHFPVDVVAGALLGVLAALLAPRILALWRSPPPASRNVTPPPDR